MRPAKDNRPVTCPFGKKGSAWSTGEHGGIDYGCPTGDPVYAMWDGTLTGTSWGSAYGTQWVIDHDTLPNGKAGLWAVYAHLSSKVGRAGQRVKAGDIIGYSNNTGNTSGAHLHVEVQPQSTWVKGSYKDPQPWVDATHEEYDPPSKHGDVYVSLLKIGARNSDSVSRLQRHLNDDIGSDIGHGGNYGPATDELVRADQTAHGWMFGQDDPDPEGESNVGPKQAEHIFTCGDCTLIE